MAKLTRWRRRGSAGSGATGADPTGTAAEGPDEPSGAAAATTVEEPADNPADQGGDGGGRASSEVTDATREPTAVAVAERPPTGRDDDRADDRADDQEPRAGRAAWLTRSQPVSLLLAAHPRQAVVTALALGGCALLADRPLREAALVAATVLVGQVMLGWHNDLVDRARDARHQTPRKPLADGRLEPGSVWFALTVALLLVVPLSVSTGLTAGIAYLLSLVVGLLGNVLLREGLFSWVPWAVSFALYPAYLSYGGWGGSAEGQPPEVWMTVLAGLLGIGVHLLRAIWGLVADDLDAWRYLPLRLGRRLGASRLLALAVVYCGAVVAAMIVVGTSVGLRR